MAWPQPTTSLRGICVGHSALWGCGYDHGPFCYCLNDLDPENAW
jgi:hypothetical protein